MVKKVCVNIRRRFFSKLKTPDEEEKRINAATTTLSLVFRYSTKGFAASKPLI